MYKIKNDIILKKHRVKDQNTFQEDICEISSLWEVWFFLSGDKKKSLDHKNLQREEIGMDKLFYVS